MSRHKLYPELPDVGDIVHVPVSPGYCVPSVVIDVSSVAIDARGLPSIDATYFLKLTHEPDPVEYKAETWHHKNECHLRYKEASDG